MKKIFFLSLVIFLVPLSLFAQTVTPNSNGQICTGTVCENTSQMCTGNQVNNLADVQNCVNLAESEGQANGYSVSCTINQIPQLAGDPPVYTTDCTTTDSAGNTVTGSGAANLAGYYNPNAAFQYLAPGWVLLPTETSSSSSGGGSTAATLTSGANNQVLQPSSGFSSPQAAQSATIQYIYSSTQKLAKRYLALYAEQTSQLATPATPATPATTPTTP